MTERELLEAIHQGAFNSAEHPCAACREGIDFSEFPHFHGSDFGKCVRQAQYDKIVKPDPITDPVTLQFLHDGHLHEKAMVDALRAAGVKIDHRLDSPDGVQTDEFIVGVRAWENAHEIRSFESVEECRDKVEEGEIIIMGHTDGVINDRFLFEAKSVKDWAFKNKFKRGQVPANYYGQMQCYMNCLDLDGGFLFVKARHTSETMEPMFVERSQSFFRRKIADFNRIMRNINNGQWCACTAKTSDEKRYCDACKSLGR